MLHSSICKHAASRGPAGLERYINHWRKKPLHCVVDQFRYKVIDSNVADGIISRQYADALRADCVRRQEEGEATSTPRAPSAIVQEKTAEEKEMDANGLVYKTTVHKCGGKGGIIHVREVVRPEAE